MVMTRGKLRRSIDAERVQAAIAACERRTSAEIRVSLSTFFWGRVESAANKAFDRLGMRTTDQRNGVLIFVVPSRRTFVVLGDEGIHAKVGDTFWKAVAAAISARFKERDFTGGLLQGIETIGEALAEHFPYDGEHDRNELPDEVDLGGEE
jgi:uncharacterized membrane protein